MKVSKSSVQHWLDAYPDFKKRSMMYAGTAKFISQRYPTAEGAEYVQLAVLIHRRMQDCIVNDEKGNQLEAQHLYDEGFVSKEVARSGQVFVNGEWRRIIK